jgi:hypothetical protein
MVSEEGLLTLVSLLLHYMLFPLLQCRMLHAAGRLLVSHTHSAGSLALPIVLTRMLLLVSFAAFAGRCALLGVCRHPVCTEHGQRGRTAGTGTGTARSARCD